MIRWKKGRIEQAKGVHPDCTRRTAAPQDMCVRKVNLIPSFFLKDISLGLVGGVFQVSKSMATNFRAAGLKVGGGGRGYRRVRIVTRHLKDL